MFYKWLVLVLNLTEIAGREIIKFRSWHDLKYRRSILNKCCGRNLRFLDRKNSKISDFEIVLHRGTCSLELQCAEYIKYAKPDKPLRFASPNSIISRENDDDAFLSFRELVKRGTNVSSYFRLQRDFWDRGVTGEGVKIGILDTGIAKRLLNSGVFGSRIKANIDWTNEQVLDDLIGHGTFLASLLGATGVGVDGRPNGVHGIVPNADLYNTFSKF